MKTTQLTEHFTLDEAVYSTTAIEHKIEDAQYSVINSPKSMKNMQTTLNLLETLRRYIDLPFTISSGYRSPVLNTLVGGSKTSYHTKGLAFDIQIKEKHIFPQYLNSIHDGLSSRNNNGKLFYIAAYFAKHHNLFFDKIIAEKGPDMKNPKWIHFQSQPDPKENRNIFYAFGAYTRFNYFKVSLDDVLS
jgi:hypothetical protein